MKPNGAYAIEHGVPLSVHSQYPLAALGVGDSFLAVGKSINTLCSACRYVRRSTGFTFACRTEPTGVRVWRIA